MALVVASTEWTVSYPAFLGFGGHPHRIMMKAGTIARLAYRETR